MVTLVQIAECVKMSPSTISAVLNNKKYCYVSEKNRNLIFETAQNLGYSPNQMSRGLQGLPTGTMGVIASLFRVPIKNNLSRFINEEIWNSKHHVLWGDSFSDEKRELKLIRDFLARGVDGLIIRSCFGRRKLETIIPRSISYCTFDSKDSEYSIDRQYGASMAVEHLIQHGHRKIGFVTSSLEDNLLKFQGYKNALAKNKLNFENRFCIELHDDYMNQVGRCVDIITNCGITACITINDYIALALIRELTKRGKRVPEDVAFIGFDGLDICGLVSPSLTSVRQPIEKLAKKVVACCLQRMEGQKKLGAGI